MNRGHGWGESTYTYLYGSITGEKMSVIYAYPRIQIVVAPGKSGPVTGCDEWIAVNSAGSATEL
jgi:hypothetical protein